MRALIVSTIMLAVLGGQLGTAYTACKSVLANSPGTSSPAEESLPAHCAGMTPSKPAGPEACADRCGRTAGELPALVKEIESRFASESYLLAGAISPAAADVPWIVLEKRWSQAPVPLSQGKVFLVNSCLLI